MNRWWTLLAGLFLHLSVWGQSPLDARVETYSVEQLELSKALLHLSEVARIDLFFSNQSLPAGHIVTLSMQNTTVQTVLNELLRETPLSYRTANAQIFIQKRSPPPSSEQKFTLSGYVEDQKTGERLISATIFVPELAQGTVTNEYGFFSLTIPAGTYEYTISYLGYQQLRKQLTLTSNQSKIITLQPSLTLREVVVRASDQQSTWAIENLIDQSLPLETLESLPSLVGEADLNQVLALLPGIQTGPDGVGGLHVRGGSKDQNLYMIDGVPVYNPSHALGFLSVFNPSAIKDIRLIKGNFPARYGGRLSSVLDVRTKEGNLKEFEGEASIGLVSSRVTLEGPIFRDKTSFLVSGRFSLLNTYLRPVTQRFKERNNILGETGYDFYDLNAKFQHKFSKNDAVYLSFYRGADNFFDDSHSIKDYTFFDDNQNAAHITSFYHSSRSIIWGNTIGALRWNHLFNNKLFANTTLTFSEYRFDDRYSVTDSLSINELTRRRSFLHIENLSSIRDIAARTDFDFVPNNNHYIRFGAGVTQHEFVPGILLFNQENNFIGEASDMNRRIANDSLQSLEWMGYFEDRLTLSPNFVINLGARISYLDVGSRGYFDLQPRLSTYWRINSKFFWTASVSKMTQFLHLLSSSTIGLTTDLWVPSTENIRPQESWQGDVSLNYSPKPGWQFTLSSYYKWMDNLITYTEGGNTLTNWENNVTAGRGRAYGLEFLAQKTSGKTTGWLSYTLAQTNRQFDEVNLGREFPYRFDRRHNFQIAAVHQLRSNIELSGNWTFGTGLAFSAPEGKFLSGVPSSEQPPFPIFIYDSKNKFRMPAYHRLDLSVNIHFDKKSSKQTLKIGGYNIYNRRHPLYFALRNEPKQDNVFNKEFVQVKLLPFIPSISYTIKL